MLSVAFFIDRTCAHLRFGAHGPEAYGEENTAGFTSKYNSKIRGALKDLELQSDPVHETTSGA